ncbi:MAG: PorP/SprF family type IX secretion system membrane protein [Saprospiraceae bacterium]|nr:PorP/SprF family type IX secretion system membrane protein [Saprospiraceae bacterium]MDW8483052.1 PorP/SprF family type IX secretion system membrane protein [Saprospiraceae bacterium]
MKKVILSLCFFAALIEWSLGQQQHHYTQFMFNKLPFNPAYAGARGVPTVTAIYRNQWMGFEGAPQSFLASFNTPFITPRVGMGIVLSHLALGLNRDIIGSLSYSYDMVSHNKLSFRGGLMGTVRSLSIDFTKARPGEQFDQSIGSELENQFLLNVGAGIYMTYDNRFYAGFSAPRIYANTIGNNDNLPQGFQTAREFQHFYGMAGAVLPLGDGLNLMPALFAKYVKNAPLDLDVNLNMEINEKFITGFSCRTGGDKLIETINLIVFWQAHRQFGIGVAYDFSLSNIRDYTTGSIEVLLQADLRAASGKRQKMSNPRFFM